MFKSNYGTFSPFLILTAFLMAYQVYAIDGDYATPYADNITIEQCAQDDQECDNARPNTSVSRQSELPIMTLLGGALLVGGVFAAVVWKIREKKRSI